MPLATQPNAAVLAQLSKVAPTGPTLLRGGPLIFRTMAPADATRPMSLPMAPPPQPRDLSLNASGTGETLLVVLAAAALALGGAYAAGIGPFKRTRARKARR